LKVNEKMVYPLKSGRLFAVMEVRGKRGEILSLTEQGIKSKLLFFHEEPANGIECSYSQSQGYIELGGAATESNRTIYAITSNEKDEAASKG